MRSNKPMKTEEEFIEECDCAYKILSFVEKVESDARWWFHIAYYNEYDDSYSVLFKSYVIDEYKDYILSIFAVKEDAEWKISVHKKVDNLVKH